MFHRIDASLLSLRRLVDAPRTIPTAPTAHGRVDVSTVLVVDAVSRVNHHPGRAPDAPTEQASGLSSATSIAEIAGRLNVAPSTASRLVSRAVTAGMVTQAPDRFDGRRVHVTMTARGRSLQRRAVRFRSRRLAEALDSWTTADLAEFDRLLGRFAADTRSLATGRPAPELAHTADRRGRS